MTHRRSKSQRIGKRGEALFEGWVVDAGLSANKTEEDYGIDYHCEVLRQDDDGHETATGSTIAVWVRATTKIAKPRVKIDRDDAERMLECELPACLAAVDLDNKRVAFRILDASMQAELREFLNSSKDTKSWTHESMSTTGAALREQLRSVLRPVVQRRLARERLSHSLEQRFGAAEFEIHERPSGTDATLVVPWAGHAIDTSKASPAAVRAALADMRTLLPEPGSDGFAFHPTVLRFLDHADRRVLIAGGGFSVERVRARCNGTEAEVLMHRRVLGDWWSYTHPVGVSFAAADAREVDGQWVHPMDFILHRVEEYPLSQSPGARDFLRLLRSGAELSLGEGGWMDLEQWWPDAVRVGPAIDAFEAVSARTGISLRGAFLADVEKERPGVSLGLLESLLVDQRPLEQVYPGVVFEEPLGGASGEQVRSLGDAYVPVVAQFSGKTLIVWCYVEVIGVLNDDGTIVGAHFVKQQGVDLEETDEEYPVVPGVYFVKEWPAFPIPISTEQRRNGMSVKFSGPLSLSALFDNDD